MALGTAAAIGLGVAGIGSALGGASAAKGASKAADAQLAVAQENNALQKDIYGQNKATLSPFVNSGVTAGNYLNAFLGLPTQQTNTGGFDASAYLSANPDVAQEYNKPGVQDQFSTPQEYAQWHYNRYGQTEGRADGSVTTPAVTQGQAQNAFASYLGNSDYGYQSVLGQQQVNGGYAGSGALQSGAALKALQTRQNNINTGYQTNYLGQLAGQQAVGLSGASALAGVGQTYAGAVSANNSSAADATSNSALINGQNNPFANALSTLGGGLLSLGTGGGSSSSGNSMGSTTTWPRGIY